MICQDGFITSHGVQNISLLPTEPIQDFVGTYRPEEYLLHAGHPMAVGPYAISDYVMEARKAQRVALENAKQVILDVANEFAGISGRQYGLFEEYKTEDADYVMMLIGSAAGTAKDAVDHLREQGYKVGVLKLRVFRPFPEKEIAEALKNAKAVAIMDRAESYNGQAGVLGSEVTAGLYRNHSDVLAINYTYGLGGRDFTTEDVARIFDELKDGVENGKEIEQYQYVGLRG